MFLHSSNVFFASHSPQLQLDEFSCFCRWSVAMTRTWPDWHTSKLEFTLEMNRWWNSPKLLTSTNCHLFCAGTRFRTGTATENRSIPFEAKFGIVPNRERDSLFLIRSSCEATLFSRCFFLHHTACVASLRDQICAEIGYVRMHAIFLLRKIDETIHLSKIPDIFTDFLVLSSSSLAHELWQWMIWTHWPMANKSCESQSQAFNW